MEIAHLDDRRYVKWRARLGTGDARHVRRRVRLLAEQGVGIGLPNVRRLFGGVWELRCSGGQRLYFVVRNDTAIFVEYGDKGSQPRDIQRAMRTAGEIGHDA